MSSLSPPSSPPPTTAAAAASLSARTNEMSFNNNDNMRKKPIRPLVETETTILQHHTEQECKPFFVDLSTLPKSELRHLQEVGLLNQNDDDDDDQDNDITTKPQPRQHQEPKVQLLRSKHMKYVEQVWKRQLKAPFVSLDSSRPWMLYWCLHSYDLLHQQQEPATDQDGEGNDSGRTTSVLQLRISNTEGKKMVETLRDCFQSYYCTPSKTSSPNQSSLYHTSHQMDDKAEDGDDDQNAGGDGGDSDDDHPRGRKYFCGGFGGGPGQMAHAATTYAAILSLCILATATTPSTVDKSTTTGSNGNHEEEEEEEEGAEDEDDEDYDQSHFSVDAMELLEEVRIPLYRWIVSLQVPALSASPPSSSTTGAGASAELSQHSGGFRMHHDGEVDVRATYCVMTVLGLLGLLTLQQQPSLSTSVSSSSSSPSSSDELSINYQSAIDYVVRCQTYEGGIGGEPWTEAHGGYTFCGVAALQIMGYFHTQKRSQHASFSSSPQLDIQSLVGWLSRRQLSYEGGFSGRSNKLVDGCYSFWQGGAIAIASAAVAGGGGGISNDGTPHDPWLESYRRQGSDRCMTDSLDLPFPLLFDVAMLERYILLCAQEIEGGLRDKPSKPRDFYHSCYNLSGLSVAQKCSRVRKSYDEDELSDEWFGDQIQTSLAVTHPVYNIRIERVDAILTKTWD